ncbi:hypothetical protein FRB99_006453 [Tulasnella sp. 403]|nr:hypothetical protein FRB99_006453 [Tulasnella sp. 403]
MESLPSNGLLLLPAVTSMPNILSLPPELLTFILLETQADARVYNISVHKEPFPFAPDTLDQLRFTNRAFNSVILGSAQLWSFIAITGDRHKVTVGNKKDRFLKWERHIARYVERSGNYPLDVTITVAHSVILQNAYIQISPHFTRLRSLRFLIGHPTVRRLQPPLEILRSFLTNHSFPKLKTLTVQTWVHEIYFQHVVIHDAPQLTDLTCTGNQAHWVNFEKPSDSPLRSLRFTSFGTDPSLFVAILQPVKETLEFLDIDFHLGGFVRTKGLHGVALHALHTLRVNFITSWELFTKYIHVPNLRSLTLSRPPPLPAHKCNRKKRPLKSMPLLHTLEWHAAAADGDDTRESFEAVLAACPNVRQLAVVEILIKDKRTKLLSDFGPLEKELEVLAAKEEGQVKFCAGLEVLRVSCPSSELLDGVKKIREGVLEVVQTDYRTAY